VQEPRPHHLAPIGEPTTATTAPSKIFLDKSPDKLAAKRKPAGPLPARTPTHPASPLTPMRGGGNQGGGNGVAGAGPGSPLRGKPDDGSFGTDPAAQSRPGTAGSQWEPPTDGTAYIGLAYALRQYPNSTEFVYLRRLDRCAPSPFETLPLACG